MNTPTPMTETDEDRESLARGEIPAHIAMPSNVAATPLTDELLAKARTKKLLSSDPRLPWYRLAVKLERDLAAAQERVEDLEVRCANAEARAENWHKVADSRSAELIKQMARAEASERDAQRYRQRGVLAEHCGVAEVKREWHTVAEWLYPGDEICLIDAAIAEGKK